MRLARFVTYLSDLISSTPNPAVSGVTGYAGTNDTPVGLQVSFSTGASIVLGSVRTAASGGDSADSTERIIEGEPPQQTDVPAFDLDRQKISVKQFETWIAALITNSKNTEVESVRPIQGGTHRYGLDVAFHSGAHIYVYFTYTLAPGKQPGSHPPYQGVEAI
ncbi:hypothetical protein [Nonomuraea longicatena]|uniref:Uncharacterized protein n=1 Tax=Nonomuraea longicatena TaxID=83682 RepID=A0ABP3ZRG6_9ACTN